MSAQAGWYPDPGGAQDLYRYWDGRTWSAATSPHPSAPPPTQGIPGVSQPGAGQPAGTPGQGYGGQTSGSQAYGYQAYGSQGETGQTYGSQGRAPGSTPLGGAAPNAYASYQQTRKRRSPVGWWVAGIALVAVIGLVVVLAVRAATGGGLPGLPGGQSTQDSCPPVQQSLAANPDPADGRVHGGPVSYPQLGQPWSLPSAGSNEVPFASDIKQQSVTVEPNYDGSNSIWVASVLVAELQAGDGFFSPQQGSAVVVKCVLGTFYGDNPVTSDEKKNEAITIDGHDGWLVESQLSFDIPGLQTKGELLIVAIVSAGATSGLYYASIPDTRPDLVQPAREALAELTVDG